MSIEIRDDSPLVPAAQHIANLENIIKTQQEWMDDSRKTVEQLQQQVASQTQAILQYQQQLNLVHSNGREDWEIKADKVLAAALFMGDPGLKIPYVFGGEYENDRAFDCSSLTQKIFSFIGVKLPRSSREQAKVGIEVAYADMKPGDIILFDFSGDGVIDHVGTYAGNGQMVHTNNAKKLPRLEALEGYWKGKFVTSRRVITR